MTFGELMRATRPSLRSLDFAAAIFAVCGGVAFLLPYFGGSRSGDGHPGILPSERMNVVEQSRPDNVPAPIGAPDAARENTSGRRKADPHQIEALHDLMAPDLTAG